MGVLIEFFYGYPDDPMPPRLIHGHDILSGWNSLTGYSAKTGRPHDLRMNIKVCRLLGIKGATAWWARTVAFDALIGNTDRHTENWGVLVARQRSPERQRPVTAYAMAPAFDNATSLGYEISDERLIKFQSSDALSSYIQRGTHHIAWSPEAAKGVQHGALCKSLCEAVPSAGAAMLEVIRLTDSQVQGCTDRCIQFDVPHRFTRARGAFVQRLIRVRRDALVAMLEG